MHIINVLEVSVRLEALLVVAVALVVTVLDTFLGKFGEVFRSLAFKFGDEGFFFISLILVGAVNVLCEPEVLA